MSNANEPGEVRKPMKNSKGRRSRGTADGAAREQPPQLDFWSSSPVGASPPIAALPARRIDARNSTQGIASNGDSRSVSTTPGRWPIKHGTRIDSVPSPTVSHRLSGMVLPQVPLTRRQHELLDYLRRRREQGLLPPSLTEICHDLGLASRGSLHKQVVALVKAGLVEAMAGKQRGVRLVDAANDDGRVPLFGAIAAGRPIEAVLRPDSVEAPAWLTRGVPCYALKVKGDSMRDAGILDGDIVLVEPRSEARNGETVVALIDGDEATLKRIEQRPGEVLLIPENSAHTVQRYTPDRVAIQGIVIGALRRY